LHAIGAHLPGELAKRWASVRESLLAIRALDKDSGRLEATLLFTDEKELRDIARKVLEIYVEVPEASGLRPGVVE
jgi:hypothetical protein